MEDQLDEISNGRAEWRQVVGAMWDPLSEQVERARAAVADRPKTAVPGYDYTSRTRRGRSRRTPAETIGEDCPECGSPLVRRAGKHGPFIGCEGYPTCKFTRSLQTGPS
jgi:DNA topoisomerase-1